MCLENRIIDLWFNQKLVSTDVKLVSYMYTHPKINVAVTHINHIRRVRDYVCSRFTNVFLLIRVELGVRMTSRTFVVGWFIVYMLKVRRQRPGGGNGNRSAHTRVHVVNKLFNRTLSNGKVEPVTARS
jgi:hypothetical protein